MTLDLDNVPRERVNKIIEKVKSKISVRRVEVWQRDKKHFHVVFILNAFYPLYILFIMRLLAGDDYNRLRYDIGRTLSGFPDHTDKLFKLTVTKKRIGPFVFRKVKKYRLVEVIE